MSTAVELRRYDGAVVAADAVLRSRLGQIYADAFGRPPHEHPGGDGGAWAEDTLLRHAGYPGFGLITAVRRQEIGFGYGYISSDDQWFTQTIRPMVPKQVAVNWLGQRGRRGELVELAVLGPAQGQGIGGAIHDAVLDGLRAAGADRALLVTHRDAVAARSLYQRRGWQVLAGLEPASLLMGIRLPCDRRHDRRGCRKMGIG